MEKQDTLYEVGTGLDVKGVESGVHYRKSMTNNDTQKKYAISRVGRQALSLFASHIFVMILSVATGAMHTRILEPKDYGVLSFVITITGFSMLFFRFGFFSSAGLLLASEKDPTQERKLIGALTVTALIIGLCYFVFIFAFSFYIDEIFKTEVKYILRSLAALLVFIPFQMAIPQVGKGTNKISHIALFKVMPKTIYVIIVSTLFFMYLEKIDILLLLFINYSCVALGVVVMIYLFKPLFSDLKENLRKLWAKNKEYGIHIYWGQIADQSTYKLDGIFISYFVDTTRLGYYSLANFMVSPLVAMSQALSTSLFKSFSRKTRVPSKVILYNFIWLLAGVIGLLCLGEKIVGIVFTEKYMALVPFILPLSLAGFFQGMYQPLHMFLSSQGKGEWLRNISFIESLFNVVGNLVFILYWGVWGVAVASAIAKFISYCSHCYYYKKYLLDVGK